MALVDVPTGHCVTSVAGLESRYAEIKRLRAERDALRTFAEDALELASKRELERDALDKELEKARFIEVHEGGDINKVRAVDYLNAVLARAKELEKALADTLAEASDRADEAYRKKLAAPIDSAEREQMHGREHALRYMVRKTRGLLTESPTAGEGDDEP